jgi:5-methylcytosine-specific restriction endonuclease McrA
MQKTIELKFLRSIKTGKGLLKLIANLKINRRNNKIKGVKRSALTQVQRKQILEKTNSHCHICGIEISNWEFQADHVKPHSSGGLHSENNYLPACSLCNNYRWHYSPEEIQIIL